jgi:hypothetical protein
MTDARTSKVRRYAAMGVVGGALLMLLPLAIPGSHGPGIRGDRILAWTAAVAAAMSWAFYFARLGFRASDEFRQEGMKFAWHWGAIGGLFLSAPIYTFIGLGGLHWLDPSLPVGADLSRAFVMGYCLAIFPQVLGFQAVLAWWGFSKR